jgi:hypothetical protein
MASLFAESTAALGPTELRKILGILDDLRFFSRSVTGRRPMTTNVRMIADSA